MTVPHWSGSAMSKALRPRRLTSADLVERASSLGGPEPQEIP